METGQLIPGTGNVGPGPFYAGRWCEACGHAHGEAHICLTYPESVIENMIQTGWIKQSDYDAVAMMFLGGKSDETDGLCEYPECRLNGIERSSMTCYIDSEGVPTEEKNPKPVLCDEHAEEYTDYWGEMWTEYRSS
jgi:hypothetical protein